MSRPLIRRRGGRIGFRWRSDASFLAMNLSRSVRVKRIELYRYIPQPGPRLPARAHPAAQDFDPQLSEQAADGGARRDVAPGKNVLSGDGRPPPAGGSGPAREGPG